MNKNDKLVMRMLVGLSFASASLSVQAALPDGAVLEFIAGVPSYDSSGNPVDVSSGSYFAVDFNGNGVFTGNEKTAMAMHEGVIIGASQPASGSHAGVVDGSETPSIDAPWNFFGNAGMFQTLSPVVDYGDGTLDFSGLGATWAGISNIPIGDTARTPIPDTLRATIVCTNTPCQVGDNYVLTYTGHVPMGHPSGFGGVLFGLHLEGTITDDVLVPRISINITDGAVQECAEQGGTQVAVTASVNAPPGDSIVTIDWTLDGVAIGSGEQIVQLVSLGIHSLSAEVQTLNGQTASSTKNITIQDTQQPVVTAAFINTKTGQVVNSVDKNARLSVRASADDVCDAHPVVNAMIGAPVSDGGLVDVKVEKGLARHEVSQMNLSVTATDASGNAAVGNASLTIGQ